LHESNRIIFKNRIDYFLLGAENQAPLVLDEWSLIKATSEQIPAYILHHLLVFPISLWQSLELSSQREGKKQALRPFLPPEHYFESSLKVHNGAGMDIDLRFWDFGPQEFKKTKRSCRHNF
jgi:hypothetical protein